MFWAINSKTEERVPAHKIFHSLSYINLDEEIFYAADIDNIEIINQEIAPKDLSKIEVKYVKEKNCVNKFGTKWATSPHFKIPNAKKLGINYKPESKEHKLAKNMVFELIHDAKEPLYLCYAGKRKEFKYQNKINIFDLDIDFINIDEEYRADKRRFDVHIPLKSTHPLFGKGFAVEIQLSNQSEKRELERTYETITTGFSVIWIKPSDLEFDDNSVTLKQDFLVCQSFASLLWKAKSLHVSHLERKFQQLARMFDEKALEFEYLLHEKYNEFVKNISEKYDEKVNRFEPTIITELNNLIEQTNKNYSKSVEKILKIDEIVNSIEYTRSMFKQKVSEVYSEYSNDQQLRDDIFEKASNSIFQDKDKKLLYLHEVLHKHKGICPYCGCDLEIKFWRNGTGAWINCGCGKFKEIAKWE